MTHDPELVPPDPLPVGYVLHDRYVIESELAPQRMGRLYKASYSLADGAHVAAINVLAPEFRSLEGVRRFWSAVRRATLMHPGRVLDYGEHRGVAYAVLVYTEGSAVLDVGLGS
jgi:hypothetical protein